MVKKKRIGFGEDKLSGYLFISPWIIGFLLFTVYPLLSSLYYSFTSFDLLSSPKWIGIDNYTAILTDPRFFQSMKVTFVYALVHVPLKLAFALGIAMLFNLKHRGVGTYRTLYYLPSIVGGSIAVSVMWMQLFASNGAFNSFLGNIGIKFSTNWVGSPDTALWTIIVLGVWQFGSPMLIFLAGLKQIPASYYEAAHMEGANPLKRFLYITLPCLSPIIFFNLLMQMISAFMAFTQSYVISNGTGSPSDSTLFYALYVYLQGFKYGKMGYGAALAWVMVVIIAIATAIIFKTSDNWVFYEEND